jgi:hypothetical protein
VSGEYEGTPRLVYGEGATFLPVCEKCGRYVKADATVTIRGDGQPSGPNATCSRDGRVAMLFEGYV